jgi:hypothetical protein
MDIKCTEAELAATKSTSLTTFTNATVNTQFTFHMPVPEPLVADCQVRGLKHDLTQQPQVLKRPMGHPDAPSVPNSPESKRVHEHTTSVSHDLPPPTLLFPSTTGTGASGDIFGGSVDVPLLLKKKNAKIDIFFMVETAEAKAERNTWDFEGIAADKEQQDFHDALSLMRRNARQRQVD